MENDFKALLASDPTIAGIVSARIYPSTYAQNAAGPAMRYQKITGSIGMHMEGSDGLSTDLMQVDVRAELAADVFALRNAIVAALHGFSGTKGNTTFQLIELRDDRGTSFETTGAQNFYTRSMDFDVSSRAAA
jgi:hypothetical protein